MVNVLHGDGSQDAVGDATGKKGLEAIPSLSERMLPKDVCKIDLASTQELQGSEACLVIGGSDEKNRLTAPLLRDDEVVVVVDARQDSFSHMVAARIGDPLSDGLTRQTGLMEVFKRDSKIQVGHTGIYVIYELPEVQGQYSATDQRQPEERRALAEIIGVDPEDGSYIVQNSLEDYASVEPVRHVMDPDKDKMEQRRFERYNELVSDGRIHQAVLLYPQLQFKLGGESSRTLVEAINEGDAILPFQTKSERMSEHAIMVQARRSPSALLPGDDDFRFVTRIAPDELRSIIVPASYTEGLEEI